MDSDERAIMEAAVALALGGTPKFVFVREGPDGPFREVRFEVFKPYKEDPP